MTYKNSMERALDALGAAEQSIAEARLQLSQLDRCTRLDYPSRTPPLMRCCLEVNHNGPHRYCWPDSYHPRALASFIEGEIEVER